MRTNIAIDDKLMDEVLRVTRRKTKCEAVAMRQDGWFRSIPASGSTTSGAAPRRRRTG
ncbi:MAG: type II toxin-antitoxin system VapB family antitoxin [Zoogloeaceae bacterium]|nr:type II toxin-antitoxin system VapB family antitoxin [Zoogloeaceae bacterium]